MAGRNAAGISKGTLALNFLMLPDKARYADIAHSYIMELKYVQPTASDAEVEGKSREAEEQLKKYGADRGQSFCAAPGCIC